MYRFIYIQYVHLLNHVNNINLISVTISSFKHMHSLCAANNKVEGQTRKNVSCWEDKVEGSFCYCGNKLA